MIDPKGIKARIRPEIKFSKPTYPSIPSIFQAEINAIGTYTQMNLDYWNQSVAFVSDRLKQPDCAPTSSAQN